ncbi:MAG: FliM/FliN family flagellar motor switch protein [Blastocatellia bacterium]|nr:FliM/FliN family flagellar motor switch protein [Blastocatellia bacterium]
MASEDDNALRDANEADIEAWRNYLDLSVQFAVELGRAALTVRDVLNLELNSILQLPRSTGEGVDLLIGGHRIGRGEIVMLEDRTGVRINDLIVEERA